MVKNSSYLITLVDVSCASFPAAAPQAVALPMLHSLGADLASHLLKIEGWNSPNFFG
jgi:hypothetical protein